MSTTTTNGPTSAEEEEAEEKEIDFATIRVQQTGEQPHLTHHSIEEDSTGDCWLDLINFTPGALPRVTTIAITIGIVCGIVAYLYYAMLFFLLQFIWHDIPEYLVDTYDISPTLHWLWIPIVGFVMAIGVGLSVVLLGEPGDLSYTVQCVRDKAFIEMDHVLPMVCASQFSILGGGSLGPEAPLVAVCAAFAALIGRKVFGTTRTDLIRKHTLMGMSCALAAFFGVPLGGSLFALEINNRFGIEYYEHMMHAIFSGTVCLVVFRGLAGLDIGPVWQLGSNSAAVDSDGDDTATTFTMTLGPCQPSTIALGALLGLVGAGVAAIFVYFHKYVVGIFKHFGLMDNKNAIQRALVGSSVIIIIGIFIPQTLFWGELEIPVVANGLPASELPNVFPTSGLLGYEMSNFGTAMIIGIMKLVAISFTVAGGYRGGFIFPFFFVGTAFGKALTYLIGPELPVVIATLCIAAGINVAITRTALASTLILCGLSGEINAGPPVLAASLVSLFATAYMPFIRTQATRNDITRVHQKPIEGGRWIHENFTTSSSNIQDSPYSGESTPLIGKAEA